MACTPCTSVIADPLANLRVTQFMKKKTNVLDGMVPGGENAVLGYPFNVFIPMLEMFRDSAKGYSGIRIYFASYMTGDADTPTDLREKLTLLFVPTTKQQINPHLVIHKDDLSSIYTIIKGTLKHLADPSTVAADKDQASRWVKNFRNNRLPGLKTDGQNHINGFKESMSIWYSMGSLKGDITTGDTGIIPFARCMHDTPPDPTNPVDGIVVRFSAFIDDEIYKAVYPPYQLTVLFVLHQKHDPAEAGIAFGSGTDKILEVPTDTGLPCPPDVGCTGGGSLLPAS